MMYILRIPRWNDVLVELHRAQDRHSYCERLNRRIKASLTHVREIVKMLVRHRLVKVQPMKKIKHLALTDKGKRVAGSIIHIKTELGLL